MPRSRYGRSPALDGLRGVFMACFLAFHFGATFLSGMWIAINLFFVLSGFLITRLLFAEKQRTGRIDFLAFYRRRGRRVLPGLFLLLTAVTLYGCFFAPQVVRHRFGLDTIATLGFSMNWRLIALNDQYFGNSLVTPPLRHAWTLAIEEQYYVVIPVIVAVLCWVWRSRRARIAALLVAAVVMTVWTAYIADSNPGDFSRLYYGTDTRVTSLLIGTAIGIAFGWSPRGGVPTLSRRTVFVVGWAGLLSNVLLFLFIDPYTTWMWDRGGALFGAIGSAALIVALDDPAPSRLKALFSARIVRQFGRLSYSLYLWHWPVHLLLGTSGILNSTVVTGCVGFAISTVLAYLSNRFVEEPVLRDGVRALFPRLRRVSVAVVAPVVLVVALTSAVMLPANAGPTASATTRLPPALVPNQLSYVPGAPPDFGVLGDSVPWYLAKRFPARLFPGVHPVNVAHEGCDLLPLKLATAFGVKDQHAMCAETERTWPAVLRAAKAKVLLVFGSPLLAVPHVMPDGSSAHIGQPAYDDFVLQTLSAIDTRARSAGVTQIQIVNVPCREFGESKDSEQYKEIQARTPGYIEEFNNPVHINRLLARWVEGHNDAKLVDLYGALCSPAGYQPVINNLPVFNDGLHFSPAATPMVWRWMLGQISGNWNYRKDR